MRMADLAYEAQTHEARRLAGALSALKRPRPSEPQLVRGGAVVCLDCGNPVPPARLAAVPGACRCTLCQEINDEQGHRHD
jgi:phage/conjugal plasmid C-4 type zinc finger TraR family protein